MFDPNQFLDMTVESANDTVVIPVPAGEYQAMIAEVECRPWQSKTDSSKAGLALDIKWKIEDFAVTELLGRDNILVKQGIMLDVTEQGGLDMGKGRNVGLGRLRTAVNQNTAGKPWAPSMLVGNMAKVKVSHRTDDRPGAIPGTVFAEIREVAPL